jgi:hypothetical protein
MPLQLLLKDPRAGLIFSNAIGAIISNAVTFNIPLYFQAVLLESATSSGLRLVIPSAAASIVGTGTGFAITYTKRLKWPLVCGVVLLMVGTTGLSVMGRGLPNWVYMFLIVPSSMGQGFMFPATFMAVLAVSEQAEQAVVTSTLILWRSLGMVLGVASSSLVLQNALLYYLNEYVVGPDKERVGGSPWRLSKFKANARTGDRTSPHLGPGNPQAATPLPRAGHRGLRLIPAVYVHHGGHTIYHHGADHGEAQVAKIRAEEVSEIAGERNERIKIGARWMAGVIGENVRNGLAG